MGVRDFLDTQNNPKNETRLHVIKRRLPRPSPSAIISPSPPQCLFCAKHYASRSKLLHPLLLGETLRQVSRSMLFRHCRPAVSTSAPSSQTTPLPSCPARSSTVQPRFSSATASSGGASSGPSSSTPTTQVQEYNRTMHSRMHWDATANPFEYHPSRGLYWHTVADRLICGTQPRCASDVAELDRVGVTHIVSLQTDKDLQDWSVDLRELQSKCADLGIQLLRCSARDFDPHSLRKTLPRAVASVRQALLNEESKVYVHCTAGLGRAPAVCIAYMFWFQDDMDLDAAYHHVTSIRPCGPKREAIRGATFDLIAAVGAGEQFERSAPDAWATLPEEDKYALQWRLLKILL